MSQKHLVCQGATCQCQFGTLPDTLKVKTQSRYFINDDEGKEKLTATHKDLWVRNKYLHISSREYELFMGASKDENGNPKRGELDG